MARVGGYSQGAQQYPPLSQNQGQERSLSIFRLVPHLFRLLTTAALVLFLLASELWAGQANVFVYHRFGDARYPSTNIDLDVFASQLELLARRQYRVLPLGEVVDRLREGRALPERCAVLTVDDAYRSFLTGAMPLLRKYGFPATLFVSTNAIGHGGYLAWTEIAALQREGIEIGNHSSSHDYLLDRRRGEGDQRWKERVTGDIVRAQKAFAEHLGSAPSLFAYPFGEYSAALVDIVEDLGFEGAAAQQSGVVGDDSDLYALPRFPMGAGYATLEGFRQKLAMKPLPVTVVSPRDPVVTGETAPSLKVRIEGDDVDLDGLRCFVGGREENCVLTAGEEPGEFVVRSGGALVGRRGKYTLTAPGRDGVDWYWFSRLWVRPQGVEP